MAEHDSVAYRESVNVVMQYLDGGSSLKAAMAACRAIPAVTDGDPEPESQPDGVAPAEPEDLLGIDPEALSREQRDRYAALVEALDRTDSHGGLSPRL